MEQFCSLLGQQGKNRDQVWKKQVVRNWEQHLITLNYVKSTGISFDLILDATDPVEQNAQTIILLMKQKINELR